MLTRIPSVMLWLALPGALVVTAALPGQKQTHSAKKTTTSPTKNAVIEAAQPAYASKVAPLIKQFCVGCHSGAKPAGGVLLTGYNTAAAVVKGRDVWENVSKNISAAHMPPEGVPQPTNEQRTTIVSWIESTLSKADCSLDDPGRVTMRRLNREEYNNTVRDLLGVNTRPADEFPSDDVGYGFDNIGDVLSISPLLMEKYLMAAEKVTQAAIITPEVAQKPAHFDPDKFHGDGGAAEGGWFLASNGEGYVEYNFPKEGSYLLRTQAYGQQAGKEPVKIAIRLDGNDVHQFDVKAVEDAPGTYQIKVDVSAGKQKVGVAFLNDYYVAGTPTHKQEDRNLIVNSIEIVGPLGEKPPMSDAQRRIFIAMPSATVTPEQAASKILTAFAGRAFRRPVTKDEVNRLVHYVALAKKEGESFERGIQLAIEAVLVSPHFLFRVEVDKDPNNVKSKRLISDYELASRLSYFLWSSMPDDTLLALAAQKRLQDPKVLTAQVKRMLKDPKAKALGDNFASQWLTLRNLSNVAPDSGRFPGFNDALRTAMRTETEMFFTEVVRDDRSILDFIDGKFTYLNEPLAKLYGITGVEGDKFRRVTLTGDQRGGVLSQASVLTVTSNPTRTSPVKRGKWVLEQILGTPPPPPPPNVAQLPDDKKEKLVGTLRQRMEQHRKNAICASCHARMDPIGFGLENYDPIGAWRTKDGDYPVDSSGVLPGGKKFSGPAQLKTILLANKELFARSLSEKMLTYALGRGLERYDRCNVDAIAKTVAKNNYRFSALINEVVLSEPFRKRRGDGGQS